MPQGLSSYSGGELDDEIHIVWLDLCLVGGTVAHRLTAFFAAVDYDVTALCVRQRLYGAENTAAVVCSVARVYVNVQGAETERTVISRGISEREHLFAAVLADEACVVFLKALFFHNPLPFVINVIMRLFRISNFLIFPRRISRIYPPRFPRLQPVRRARILRRALAQCRLMLRPARIRS